VILLQNSCDYTYNGYINSNTTLGLSTNGICNLYLNFPLIIDPDFNNDEANKIREGAKYWEDAVGIDLGVLSISDINCSRDFAVPGCIIRSDRFLQNDIKDYPEIFLYMDNIINGNFPINKIVAHEIGHYIGISHVDNDQSIMYFATESGQVENYQISEFDIELYEQVCIYGHLN
jgi:hypothetical protein